MNDPIPLHPQPSIPNPLQSNPWAALSDAELEESIVGAAARVDAAEHTRRSLERERARRSSDRGSGE